MKNQKSWKSFVAGMLTMAMIFALGIPALAAAGKNITVYPGVNIYIDDQKLDPKDVNGNPVEVFVYNGTTYLPVRAVSEALGKPVQWEGSTNSVYVGKHTGDKPAVWLNDLDYFFKRGGWTLGSTKIDNLGVKHDHCIFPSGSFYDDASIEYSLNGQYSRLSGLFFQTYDMRNDTSKSKIEIYGDDEMLWEGSIAGGEYPKEFSIPISGVLKLKIVYRGSIDVYGYFKDCTAIGEVGLWT